MIYIESIDVSPFKAEAPSDITKLNYVRSKEPAGHPTIGFMVKLAIKGKLPTDGMGMNLYLDDYKVRKYSQCRDGICFKVYNPRFLRKHSGKVVGYEIGNLGKIESDIKFPEFLNQAAIDRLVSR